MVWSQPKQIVFQTLSQKSHQKRAWGGAQGVGPEFKNQYPKTTTTKKYELSHWAQWLMSVTLASWEAEIRRITIQGQPR
jgi:hypothetical protein